MKKYLSAMALAGGAIMSPSAFAEDSGVTITPMIGNIWYDGTDELEPSRNLSLAIGYKLASPLAFELAYLNAAPEIEGTDFEVDLEQLRLDALYYFGESGDEVRTFALAGVGQQEVTYADTDTEISSALFNAGLGVQAELASNFSFRGDVRAIILEELETDYGFNLGFQWFIGTGSSKKAAPAAPKKPLDSDGDGVVDTIDNCPGTPIGTPVDSTGCALPVDDDNDGVVNADDQCPNTEAGAKVDEVGCYVVISEDVTVSLNVKFANNSEEMVSGVAQIAKVAAFMKEYPLTSVVIEGHTDSQGSAAYNESLSQRRAQAVVNELISSYGISSARISAKGYGESNPIATNDTAEGRAENRRVTAVVKASVEKIVK